MAKAPENRRPYSRVYLDAPDDEKFAEVWDDDARLALWLRLLVIAESSWPTSGALPRSVRPGPLAHLVGVGLVDLVQDHRFRIHGLDAERQRRHDHAADAAAARWHPRSSE